MNTVKGTGEDQVVVTAKLLEARVEGAVVDQTAGFIDDEECEDGPVDVSQDRDYTLA